MIPSQWGSLPDWQRMVALYVNPLLQGFPFKKHSADPDAPTEGYTYFNTTTKKVRTFDGTVWRDHW